MKQSQPRPTLQKRRSERGAALVVALMLLLTLTLVGLGSLRTAAREYQMTTNRSYVRHATQVARAGVHMVTHQFRRPDLNLLKRLVDYRAIGTKSNCNNDQTLCFTAASFFSKATSSTLPHHGFRIDAFAPYSRTFLNGNATPTIYGDYLVKAHDPVVVGSRPVPGYSINYRMCTYSVTLTAAGYIFNPQVTDRTDHRYLLSEKTFKVYLQIPAFGEALCPTR